MIDAFESSFRIQPDGVFFWFIDESGRETSYTYRNARLISAALAQRLHSVGVRPGDTVVVDTSNSPESVFLILASMYGGFTLALMNSSGTLDPARLVRSLGERGKRSAGRISTNPSTRPGTYPSMNADTNPSINANERPRVAMQLNAAQLCRLLPRIRELADTQRAADRDPSAIIASITNRRRQRSIMGEQEDLVQDTVHFAERAAHIFNDGTVGITFLSGGKNSSKIVPLTWAQLTSASKDVVELVSAPGGGWQARLPLESRNLSQCVLPLYAVDGFQTMVRAVLLQHPFRLYESFDAETVLRDAELHKATQISLRESMMQDMLAIEEWRLDESPDRASRLAGYESVLLCNRSLNARTLERAIDMNASIFATFGMTETSGTIAASPVKPGFQGGLKVGKHTSVRIVDANMQGFGSLALKGPAIFRGYTNANTPQTVDHFFMTGDTAALYDDSVYIRNRSADMFVSAGENIYPAEIADVLRHVPGVAVAYVFGESDASGNMVPVAVVQQMPGAALSPDQVIATARQWLAPHSLPTEVLIVDDLPRTSSGKIDRLAAEQLFLSHLHVKSATAHHIKLPFREPLETASGTFRSHDALVLELQDARGRIGLGECGHLREASYIMESLLPAVMGKTINHPRTASAYMMAQPGAAQHPYAVAAVEGALWDLYGQAVKRPLWQLLHEEYQHIWNRLGLSARYAALPRTVKPDDAQASINAGAVIGLAPTAAAIEHCSAAVDAGYKRVTLKISPGKGLAAAQAIRRKFPDLLLTLDADRSFSESDVDELRAYDALGIGWIEDPLALTPASSPAKAFPALAALQKQLATPICIDESYTSAADAYNMLRFPELRCIAMKVAKFGGIQPTLEFLAKAKALGLFACMSGNCDTGISRRVSAAFCTLPDMVFPSDIGSTTYQFATDITQPPYVAIDGRVILNVPGESHGLGCKIDAQALAQVEVGTVVLK